MNISACTRLETRATLLLSLPALLFLGARSASSQSAHTAGGGSEIFAGSELEDYLRYLQSSGRAGLYPWSVRAFSPAELDTILPDGDDHPWAARYGLSRDERTDRHVDLIRPSMSARFNSAFPYGSNDGPIWAGRGLTTAVQGGVAVRYGRLSATFAPIAFLAQNRSFALEANGQTGDLRFADGVFPKDIDRPQRFGDGAYARLDPGQSTVRFDGFGITLGASTANEWWGPASVYPFVLGNNAAGFPHMFAGTDRPLNLWIARVHGRMIWGELSQSKFSPVTGSARYRSPDEAGRRRFATGIVAILQPRGLPGLELGAARFFHIPWPEDGLSLRLFRKPLEAVAKSQLASDSSDLTAAENQLGSVFARWVLPHSGAEVYAEFGREDHFWDIRDLLLEPEHSAGYMVGLRKILRDGLSSFTALRAEVFNHEGGHIPDRGGQEALYLHSTLRQGHTERGQLLGADVGVGSGAGSVLAIDRYDARGRWTVIWTRTLRQEQGLYWTTGVEAARTHDVMHALTVGAVRFLRDVDIATALTTIYELNRNFDRDAMNVNLVVGLRWAR